MLSAMDAKDPSQQPPRLYLKLPNLLSPTLGDLAGDHALAGEWALALPCPLAARRVHERHAGEPPTL